MAFQSSALPTSYGGSRRSSARGDPKVARGGPDDEEDWGWFKVSESYISRILEGERLAKGG